MNDLQEKIERLISEEELSSLKFFAASMKTSEMNIINEVFTRFRSEMDKQKKFYQQELKKENVEYLFGKNTFEKDSLESPKSFFEYIKENEKHQIESYIETIVTTIPIIYKKSFPNGLNDLKKIKNLYSFLKKIPIINTFDKYNFDLNVILEVDSEDIYVIRNYFLFDSLLTYYICPIFINTTFSTEENLNCFGSEFYSEKKIAEKIFEVYQKYENDLIYSVKSLKEWENDKYYKDYDFETFTYTKDLYYGVKSFALFHEYSHIILNHFYSPESNYKMEIDADILAINLLVTNTIDYYKRDLNNNEALQNVIILRIISPLMYFLLKICFQKDNLTISPSYFIRFKTVKTVLDNHLKLNNLDLGLGFTNKIETILLHIFDLKNLEFDDIKEVFSKEEKILQKEISIMIFNRLKGLYKLDWSI